MRIAQDIGFRACSYGAQRRKAGDKYGTDILDETFYEINYQVEVLDTHRNVKEHLLQCDFQIAW